MRANSFVVSFPRINSMSRIALVSSLAILAIIILGGVWWLHTSTSKNHQMVLSLLTRVKALEQEVQALHSRSSSKLNEEPANTSETAEAGVDANDLERIAERLDYLEALLREHGEPSLVEKAKTEEVTVAQDISQTEQYKERLDLLEGTIQALRRQLDMMAQSISPVVYLGSLEAELIRANRYYYELDEPTTALQAYAALLERYDLTYEETLMALTNSAKAYDEAAQKGPSFLEGSTSLLLSLEEGISHLQQEDQGTLFFRLANGCMHQGCYEDAYRLYQKAIQTMPDNKEKVSAYWSMSFAARHAVGEDAFFETLSQGHKLGSDIGVDVSDFEKEIDAPREKR
jgi:tetratricopeptide (TPR) repeat protein